MAQQGSKADASKANEAKLADMRAKSVAQDIKPVIGKTNLAETKAKVATAVKVATDIKSMEQLCDEYNRDDEPKSQGKSASKRLLEQLGLKRTSAFKVRGFAPFKPQFSESSCFTF